MEVGMLNGPQHLQAQVQSGANIQTQLVAVVGQRDTGHVFQREERLSGFGDPGVPQPRDVGM
jgi:hypothetical protein